MFKLNHKRNLFFVSSLLTIMLIGFYYMYVLSMSDEVSQYFWLMNTKLLVYIVLPVAIATGILQVFSDSIYKKWFRAFILWYCPIAAIMILSGSTGSSYAWFSKDGMATFFGCLLIIVTLIYALVQKFVYKI